MQGTDTDIPLLFRREIPNALRTLFFFHISALLKFNSVVQILGSTAPVILTLKRRSESYWRGGEKGSDSAVYGGVVAEGRNHQMPTYCVNGSLDVFTTSAEAILNDRLFLDGHHGASPPLPFGESVLKRVVNSKPFCLRTKME